MVEPSRPQEEEWLENNPLWQLHKRRMLEVDAALGDWRFEDVRASARETIRAIGNAGERSPSIPSSTVLDLGEVLNTDAQKLFHDDTEDSENGGAT